LTSGTAVAGVGSDGPFLGSTATVIQSVGVTETMDALELRSDPGRLFMIQRVARANDFEERFQRGIRGAGWLVIRYRLLIGS
jgi:hypothetical protein